MSQLVLFEDAHFADLLPLVYWRCVFDLRCGRKSLMDNAACALGQPVAGIWVRHWIADVAALRCQTPVNRPAGEGTVLVNGRWLITEKTTIHSAPFVGFCGDAIAYIACDRTLAERLSPEMLLDANCCRKLIEEFPSGDVKAELVRYPWDLVRRNADMLQYHWSFDDRAADGKVSSSAYLLNPDYIHIGERCDIKPTVVINAEHGPVFISNDTVVDVHSYVEGPAYIGPGCTVRPGSRISGGTTIGSLCKVAGEVQASILTGCANKQHDGFLGHAYVGSWVNIGAGATNGNLENTYGPIDVQLGRNVVPTGQQFVGGTIGDFVRLGIGQLLPAGAVVGFGALVATGGLAPKYVPSFAMLTEQGASTHEMAHLLDTIRMMMARRKYEMHTAEEALFLSLPEYAERCGV